jgi:hypothetical protein
VSDLTTQANEMESMTSPLQEKLLATAAVRIGKILEEPARSLGIKALASLRGYSDYLDETYRRVATFKSFANPAQLVSVLDHFVSPGFQSSHPTTPDFDLETLLERINNGDKFVVSALAGYGKSMVLRYLALSLYENPSGQIPLFIELRHLNRVTTPNLLAYINATYSKPGAVALEAFRRNLEAGTFVVLLDGFDELSHEIRKDIEAQIVAFSADYPKTAIVVSGRPDNDRFYTWKLFELVKIKAMSLPQVLELIEKLEYDTGVKKRFAAKVKRELYERHKSFMSTPLLAILMLLTFEKNAIIPEKLHLFYAQAFEVLFHQHDAMKDQYERQRKSGLHIDEFQSVFATFCLGSYTDESTEFTETEIIKYIRDAVTYSGGKSDPVDILFDLTECVCLLMKEGGSYFFIHRSFQEYFTALFLSTCKPETRDVFLDTIGNRPWDNVLPMLFEMSSAQLEPSWVNNTLTAYFKEVSPDAPAETVMAAMTKGVLCEKNPLRAMAHHVTPGRWFTRISVLSRFYESVVTPDFRSNEIVNSFVFDNWTQFNGNIRVIRKTKLHPGLEVQEVPFDSMSKEIVAQLGLLEKYAKLHVSLKKVFSAISKEERSKDKFIRAMFSQGG